MIALVVTTAVVVVVGVSWLVVALLEGHATEALEALPLPRISGNTTIVGDLSNGKIAVNVVGDVGRGGSGARPALDRQLSGVGLAGRIHRLEVWHRVYDHHQDVGVDPAVAVRLADQWSGRGWYLHLTRGETQNPADILAPRHHRRPSGVASERRL